jgi:transketolase
MRNAFAATIAELANADDRVVVLSGDIGNRLFDDFKERHPKRFYNCGVAEGNMTGMAAGMAMCGLRPFTYTITPFATTRVMEQIRIDVCYHNLPVTIVGTGSGLSYASLGPTHHSLEDVAFLRALPNMTVVCPADAAEVRAAMSAILEIDGPVYLRLGKKGEPTVHRQPPQLAIGRGLTVRQGSDVCLLGLGNMVAPSLEAAGILQDRGISAMVVSMHTVKPLDEPLLRDVLGRFAVVAVVEEHSRIGGLASAVAEWTLTQETRPAARLLSLGSDDAFPSQSGSQKYLRRVFGLTAEQIAETIEQCIRHGAPACGSCAAAIGTRSVPDTL